MRYPLFLVVALLAGVLAAAASPGRTTVVQAKPVPMDYLTRGVSAVSPNGDLNVTVTGKKEPFQAWVTLNKPAQGWSIQVWPIERNVTVLWNPDGRSFALTDDRYANHSYVLVIGTRFHMNGPKLGVQRVDLTPVLQDAFANRARRYYRKHYGKSDYDGSYSFYAKALRWVSDNDLLVAVSGITSLPLSPRHLGTAAGVKGWAYGYLLDVSHRRILRTLSKKAMRAEYGIDVSKFAGGADR